MNFAAQEKSVLCVLTLELCVMMDETSVANKFFEKCSRIFHDEKQFWSYLTTRATFHSALQKIYYLVKNSVSNQKYK